MKRKMLSVLLCAAMMGTTLAGATSVLAADDKDSDSKWEYKEATLTFLIDPDTASAGYQAVFDLCEKETGIHIETELRASGGDGDNQVQVLIPQYMVYRLQLQTSDVSFIIKTSMRNMILRFRIHGKISLKTVIH